MNILEDRDKQNYTLGISFCILYLLPVLNGFYNPYLIQHPVIFWLFDLIQFVVIPGIVFTYLVSRTDLTGKGLRLKIPRDFRGWFKLVTHSVMVVAITCFFYPTIQQYFVEWFPGPVYGGDADISVMPDNPRLGWAVIFYWALAAGIVEELVFRGLLVNIFTRKRMNSVLIVLTVSILFGLIHWEVGIGRILATFTFSVFATSYVLWSKKLIPLILGHTAVILYINVTMTIPN